MNLPSHAQHQLTSARASWGGARKKSQASAKGWTVGSLEATAAACKQAWLTQQCSTCCATRSEKRGACSLLIARVRELEGSLAAPTVDSLPFSPPFPPSAPHSSARASAAATDALLPPSNGLYSHTFSLTERSQLHRQFCGAKPFLRVRFDCLPLQPSRARPVSVICIAPLQARHSKRFDWSREY